MFEHVLFALKWKQVMSILSKLEIIVESSEWQVHIG